MSNNGTDTNGEEAAHVQEQEQSGQQQPRSSKRGSKREAKKVAELEQQVEDLTQDLQRERSDFANYQRRMESEKEQILSRAKSEVVTQLLPLLDDLERALSHIPDELSDNAWAQGVGKVYEQAQEKLHAMGIAKIDALHQPFDPHLHEAVEFEDGDGGSEVVIEELRTGYMMDDTVLRPAMVKVGKSADQEQAEEADTAALSEEQTRHEHNEQEQG